MRILICAMLLAGAFSGPAAGQATASPKPGSNATIAQDDEAAEIKLIDQGVLLVQAGKPSDAILLFEQVIADENRAHASETRQIFCARSPEETVLYAMMGAKDNKATLVLGRAWATAIFLKGFAYIDLGRGDESKALFDRAIALSPMDAQFLAELGEWYKTRKDWPNAYARFEQASAAAEFSPADSKSREKRRALRGMGYALSEQGRLDEAEALYRQCLQIDPTDPGAKSELEYIREQRLKAKPPST